MKTIEQLLELSNNPHYKFLPEEQAVLDDFLSKKREKDSQNKHNPNSNISDKSTDVRVRNIVPKVIPGVPDAPEPTDAR
jgi:hypothetical protein